MLRSGISSIIPAVVTKIQEPYQSGSFSPCRGENPRALAAWSSLESTHQSSAVSGSFGREISHSDLWTKASGARIHRLSLTMKHFWWIGSLRLTIWKLSQNFAQLGFVYTWEVERKGWQRKRERNTVKRRGQSKREVIPALGCISERKWVYPPLPIQNPQIMVAA